MCVYYGIMVKLHLIQSRLVFKIIYIIYLNIQYTCMYWTNGNRIIIVMIMIKGHLSKETNYIPCIKQKKNNTYQKSFNRSEKHKRKNTNSDQFSRKKLAI